ncbi:hypothetical protein [Alteromonas phage PB15]|nr:hypothetical protein [Alteromonas phage PB15]
MIKLPYGWDSAVQAAKEANGNGSFNNMQIAASIILELDSQLRSPAQTKTVADAYEALKDRNPSIDYSYVAVAKIAHGIWLKEGDFEFVGENFDNSIFEIFCTREQLEAYAKEQEAKPHFKATRENLEKIAKDAEGEKWTHTYGDVRCFIQLDEPDSMGCIVINNEESGYLVVSKSDLEPIKPTISESEAIGILMVNKHLSFAALLEDYDVVKD